MAHSPFLNSESSIDLTGSSKPRSPLAWYLTIGVLVNVIYASLYFALSTFADRWFSAAAAYAAACAFQYAANAKLAFRRPVSSGAQFIRYLVTTGLGMALSAFLLAFLAPRWGVPDIAAIVFSAGIVAAFNYVAFANFVYADFESVVRERNFLDRLLSEQSLLLACVGGVVALTIYFRFLLAPDFYLYEDDWLFYSTYMDHCDQTPRAVVSFLTHFVQGRPLFFAANKLLFCAVGDHLWFTYVFGAIVSASFAAIAFLLFRKRVGSLAAFVALSWMAVQPLDTTAAYLTHITSLQLGVLVCAIGLLLADKGWLVPGALVCSLSLMFYEPAFLLAGPYLALRFLRPLPHETRRDCYKLVVALLLFFAFYCLVRFSAAEARLSSQTGQNSLLEISSRLLKLFFALSSIVETSIQNLVATPHKTVWVASAFGTLVFATIILILSGFQVSDGTRLSARSLAVLALALVACFIGSYAFFLVSNQIYPLPAGRSGRYHFIGMICIGLLLGLAVATLAASSVSSRRIATLVSILVFYFCGAHAHMTQQQYITIGNFQERMVYSFASQLDDITDGRDVLILAPLRFQNFGQDSMDDYPSWTLASLQNLIFRLESLSAGQMIVADDDVNLLELTGDYAMASPKAAHGPPGTIIINPLGTAELAGGPRPRLRIGRLIAFRIGPTGTAERLTSLKVQGRELLAPLPQGGVGKAGETVPLTRFGHFFFSRAEKNMSTF